MTRQDIEKLWQESTSDDPCDFMVEVVNAALDEAANSYANQNDFVVAQEIRALKIKD